MQIGKGLASGCERPSVWVPWGNLGEGSSPRYVWYKHEQVAFEGRLVNRAQGAWAIHWLRTSGRRASRESMAQLSFDVEWMEAERINGPELAATWARLRIRAGSSTVTLVVDEKAGTVRDHLHVSVYPLAEWLAANWWFLTAEAETPINRDNAGFRRRHSLAANREGYAYPDLHVFPCGGLTCLVWRGGASPWAKTRFSETGELMIPSAEFRAVCGGFVDSVIARLDRSGIEETFLQQEWTAVQAADEDEAAFCRAAARLGWDPYAIDDAKRREVLALADCSSSPTGRQVAHAAERVSD